jgi:hypothetical protein
MGGHSFVDWSFYVLNLTLFPVSLCFVFLVSSLLACFILHIKSNLSRTGFTCCHHCRANYKRAIVGGAVPCPLPWLFGVGDVLLVAFND